MLSIEARIFLLSEDEGGLRAFSGMQPSMNVNGELIMCRIIDGPEGESIALGQEHDVRIDLPYGERFQDVIRSGFEFGLSYGGRVLGHGEVL